MWHCVVRRVASDVSKDHSASVFRVKNAVCPVRSFFLHCLTLNYWTTDTASHSGLHLQDHRVITFGHVLYLELGCAAGVVPSLGLPSQSVTVTPGASSSSIPSQNTPPSLVDATFVNIVLWKIVFIALGFVLLDVPGKVIISYKEYGRGITKLLTAVYWMMGSIAGTARRGRSLHSPYIVKCWPCLCSALMSTCIPV